MTTYKYSNNNSNTFFSQTAIRSDQIGLNYFYFNISLIIFMVPFRQLLLRNPATSCQLSVIGVLVVYLLNIC